MCASMVDIQSACDGWD